MLAPRGRGQSVAGETVTSVLSRDGASGGLPSSSESFSRGALNEGQAWGASSPRPAPKRRGSTRVILPDLFAKVRVQLSALVETS